MPKKPKIDNQLDKLFKGMRPEEKDSLAKSFSKTAKIASVPPADFVSESDRTTEPVRQKTEPESPPKRQVSRHTAMLIAPDSMGFQTEEIKPTSSYSVNFQSGERDWSTLRILDDTHERAWSAEDQLLNGDE